MMKILTWLLIGLSALAFVLAVVSVLLSGRILGVSPEAYSRACSNLALIAIALLLTLKKGE
ncbi:MAG: hypothetical protein U5R06_11615 [candidate division KSB1 bacterium]|nr:hypothetical protein [candidate division KSB1 bacterium]